MRNTWGCRVPVCFSRSAPPSGSLQEQRRAHQKEAPKLSLDFSCQWQGGCGGLDSCDLPLSPVQRWDWQPWGGESLLVGVFAPFGLEEGGGFTWRLREQATLVERRRSAAAQLSRAERRGEERSCAGETADHPSTGGTHTNKPLWLLEKYPSVPPSPSFLFLGDFWLLTESSLWQV